MQIRNKKQIYVPSSATLEPDPLAHGANYEQLLCPQQAGNKCAPVEAAVVISSATTTLFISLSLLFTSHLPQFTECQIAMTICGRLWRACAADATKNATYTIPLVQH